MKPVRPKTSVRRWIVLLIATGGLAAASRAMEPRSLPDYRARILGSGREVSIAGFPGQAILINTWATWCPPCRKKMPDFEAIHHGTGAGAWWWSA